MNTGDEFRMIVNRNDENMPGRFGTPDIIPNSEYGRQELAIKTAWKDKLETVVTYRVKRQFEVLSGPVGPQIEKLPNGEYRYLRGGGNQIQLSNDAWSNARPNRYNEHTSEPYLDIVKTEELSQEKP